MAWGWRCHCLCGSALYSFHSAAHMPGPFRLSKAGSAAVLEARLSREVTCLVPGGEWEVSHPQGSSLNPPLSVALLPGSSGPSETQDRQGRGRVQDRQQSGQTCGIPPACPPAVWLQVALVSVEPLTAAPWAAPGCSLTTASVQQACLSACWSTPEGRGRRAPPWRDGQSPLPSVQPRGWVEPAGWDTQPGVLQELVLSLRRSRSLKVKKPGCSGAGWAWGCRAGPNSSSLPPHLA